jgi:hypothetical protein
MYMTLMQTLASHPGSKRCGWLFCAGRLNHPRGDCCAAAVSGKVYVAGGWTTNYTDTLGSVEVRLPTGPQQE